MTTKDQTVTQTKKATAKVTSLTVDMSKRIDDMSPAELKAYQKRLGDIAKEKKAAEKALKNQQKEQDSQESTEELLTLIEGSGLIQVPLSALLPLDFGSFPDGDYAIRKVDATHAFHLQSALRNGDELPPITTVLTNFGDVVLDGLHRWKAYSEYMKDLMFAQERLSTLDSENYTDADKNAIAEEIQTFLVWIDERTFESTGEAIKFAFEANMKNGLPQSDQSRTRHGIWLHKYMADKGTPISLREAARRVGVQYGTLAVTLRRMKGLKKPPKMVDVVLSSDDEQFLEEATADLSEKDDRTVDTDEKHIKALIGAARYFLGVDWIDGFNMDKTGIEYLRPMLAKVTRDEMVALGTVVTHMTHIVNEHTKEQAQLPSPKARAGQLQ